MDHFTTEITAQIKRARIDLQQAVLDGDDDDQIIHLGRLEELERLAHENGVAAH